MCLIIIKKLINNNISMNDSTSILLATTILALGGLGLYMFRTTHDNEDDDNDEKYNEESIFDSSNFFNWGTDDKNEEDILDEELEENDIKPRKRNNVKTQKNRKTTGSSRRRY